MQGCNSPKFSNLRIQFIPIQRTQSHCDKNAKEDVEFEGKSKPKFTQILAAYVELGKFFLLIRPDWIL